MIQAFIIHSVNIMLLLFSIVLFLIFFAALTIAPRYEKLFGKVPMGIFNPLFPCILGRFFIRRGFYMTSIIGKKTRKGHVLHEIYFGNYDFKNQAKNGRLFIVGYIIILLSFSRLLQ